MKFLIMGYDDPIEFGHGDNTQLVIEDTKLYTHIVQLLNAIINEKYKTNEIEILEDKSDKDILSKAILIINLEFPGIVYNYASSSCLFR